MANYFQILECFNDSEFLFDSYKHKYTYKGIPYTSVTQFLQNFHQKFDQEYWSKKKSEERGISQTEILKEWKEKNDYANLVGKQTHEWIENYYNGIHQFLPENIDVVDRINKFNIAYAKYLYKLSPVKFETRIFSKKYPLAGTIDSLFTYKNKLIQFDFKTNGDFTHDDHPKGSYEKLLPPFEDLNKNHLNEYSIQVSLYSLILREWGMEVSMAYILHIGPNSEATIYRTLDLRNRLDKFLPNFKF